MRDEVALREQTVTPIVGWDELMQELQSACDRTASMSVGKSGRGIRIVSASRSVTGCHRPRNQDSHFVSPDEDLFLVADGIGDGSGGEIASQRAVQILRDDLCYLPTATVDGEHVKSAIDAALMHAHEAIVALGAEYDGIGTTTTVAVRSGDQLFVNWVGDSRVYLYRRQRIERITADDTWAEVMVQLGQMSRSEACTGPGRNVLCSHLGMAGFEPNPHPRTVRLEPGDRLLFCTDGLTDVVDENRILRVVHFSEQPVQVVNTLAHMARQACCDDDITCIACFVRSKDGPQEWGE